MQEMQEAFFKLPNEVLHRIFEFLPLMSQIKVSSVSKLLDQAYRDRIFQFDMSESDSKKILPMFFESRKRSRAVQFGLRGFLSSKMDVNKLEKNPEISLYKAVLVILVSHINNMNTLTKAMSKIEESKAIDESYFYYAGICLEESITRTKYAYANREYKQINRSYFQENCRENKIFLNFNGGNLCRETLCDANFPGCSFIEAKLRASILDRAIFTDTNCTRTDFKDSRVEGTNFKGAILMGANFEDISGSPIFDHNTILIGAKMSWCLKWAAEKSGAILTLEELEARIKIDPLNFPESLAIEARKILKQQPSQSFWASFNHEEPISPRTPLIDPSTHDAVVIDDECPGCQIF